MFPNFLLQQPYIPIINNKSNFFIRGPCLSSYLLYKIILLDDNVQSKNFLLSQRLFQSNATVLAFIQYIPLSM